MPFVSRLMIKLSLACLMTGLLFGTLLLINKAWLIHPAMWLLFPAHVELMLFGWIVQFTLGVAYWILPRFLESNGRGSKFLALLMAISWNVGMWLVIASYYSTTGYMALTGRFLEVLAVILFVVLHWKRIVTYNRG